MILGDINWNEWVWVRRNWWRPREKFLLYSRCSGMASLGFAGVAHLKSEDGRVISLPLTTHCELIEEGNAWGSLKNEL